MTSKRALWSLVSTALVLTLATPAAHAQAIKKSTLSGILTSKSVAVPNGATVTVFTTPAAPEFFILTQTCNTAPGPGSVTLNGSTFGQVVVLTGDECTSYNPGIAFPAGEVLSCNNAGTGSTENCMITGIVSH